MSAGGEPVELVVDESLAGKRLDWVLARRFPSFSRVQWRRAVDAGEVHVDGRVEKARYHVHPGERISARPPEPVGEGPEPEDIPLDVLFEDEHLAAVNKPSGMVVHPAKGHGSGTLAAALQFRFDRLSTTGGPTRPGIVHRLDRDTSGVILVAKTDSAHARLAGQFHDRTVNKEYFAIVSGTVDRDRDVIVRPIGMHPRQREKMAVRSDHATSREAETFYEVLERFGRFATLRVVPRTGRTHQIRVHLASIGAPALCDRLYGGRARITRGELRPDAADGTVLLERHALHARRIAVDHPVTGERLEIEAPLADDLCRVLDELRAL